MYHTSLICSLLLLVCHTIEASNAALDWPALWHGEVLVETIDHDAGFPGLRASFVVPASRERIWAVLLDYQNFPEIFPDIDKIQVLEHDAQGAKVEYWVDAMLRKFHYVVYRHYEKPGWRLTWRRLSGDLQRIEGSWEVRETPRRGAAAAPVDRTRVGGPGGTACPGALSHERRGALRPGEGPFASGIHHQQRHDTPQDGPDKGRHMGELGQHDRISPGPCQQKIAEIIEGIQRTHHGQYVDDVWRPWEALPGESAKHRSGAQTKEHTKQGAHEAHGDHAKQ
jgi:ribosome-associated toxin RatA of RatAB toxin-antitoxin module